MIHSIQFLEPLPGEIAHLVELRLAGGDFIRFLASKYEREYSDFIFFAAKLWQNESDTVDLWGIDPCFYGQPYILEYCSIDEVIYITFPGIERRVSPGTPCGLITEGVSPGTPCGLIAGGVAYPLPYEKRVALVRAFRIIAMKCEGIDPVTLF